jgi:Rad3-related DNA helicase
MGVTSGFVLEAVDYAQLLTSLGSADFRELRPAQDAALACYSAEHTTTGDLAIELPTGAGKSLIALLICEAWRREGATVAVLTGNKALARQMESEGQRLGVPVVRFEGEGGSIPLSARRRYRRAEAIAMMNYWVMFNQNPVVDSADLLVIDDAHLAEGALDSLYSAEIDRYDHPALFRSLVQDMALAFPDYAALQDALTDDPTRAGTELLSFLDQAAFADRLRAKIDTADELRTDTDLRFRWGRVRERLLESNIYCSNRSLWLRTGKIFFVNGVAKSPGVVGRPAGKDRTAQLWLPFLVLNSPISTESPPEGAKVGSLP